MPTSRPNEITENEDPKPGIDVKTKTVGRLREYTRRYLAFTLLIIVGLVALGSGIASWIHYTPDGERDFLEAVFSPLVALTGPALGFFFARHHDDDEHST